MALGVKVYSIRCLERRCVEYCSESGGKWNMALRVAGCGIWL